MLNLIPALKILKKSKNELAKPPSHIINISFSMGKFPNSIKKTVISLFKKDGKLNCNNFRPISLLPNLSVIFEKIIHQRLPAFLEIDQMFSNSSSDFKTNTLDLMQ